MTDRVNDRKLSPHDAAEMIGVTANTLAKWRSTGEKNLPYYKPGRIYYWQSDVQDFIESMMVRR